MANVAALEKNSGARRVRGTRPTPRHAQHPLQSFIPGSASSSHLLTTSTRTNSLVSDRGDKRDVAMPLAAVNDHRIVELCRSDKRKVLRLSGLVGGFILTARSDLQE
jgi:hypothetical protein